MRCELFSEITGTSASCQIEGKHGQYEISYQPTIKGRHQLHITVGRHHIRGSPFHVAAKLPVEKLGTPILTIKGLGLPYGVAINKESGEVVLTSHRVSVFSPSGDKLLSFGTHGAGPGQFDNPTGIAVDGGGNTLVVDCGNNRIQKFTREGKFLTEVGAGCKGREHLQLLHPSDIAVIKDMVYVVDSGNNRVQILNPDLTFFGTFGEYGSGIGQLHSPRGIACDGTGKVYLADRDNHRIQVFTAEGKFLRMFGLRKPIGIAIDTDNMVYVSDSINDRISLFTLEGQFVTSFGKRGTGPGEFQVPRGLAVDPSGVLYVCDKLNNRVQSF